jgi:hypothetical protein
VRELLALGGCLVLLCAAYPLSQAARPVVEQAPAGLTREQSEALEEKAQASLLGQFRGSLSDFLYLQVDKTVHSGVDLRGMTDAEKRKGAGAVTSGDGVEKGVRQHAGTETTVVPSKKTDWRGVLGDIERQVKPYQAMEGHSHKEPKESLQLYRLMTLSNPKFVRGWTEGSWLMAQQKEVGPEKALSFLREGEKANPESIEIASSIGWLLTRNLERYDEAVGPLARAIALGNARDPESMTTDEEEAFVSAYRFLVNNRRYAGDIAGGRRWALEGLKRFPKDPSCRKFLEDYPASVKE